MEDKLAGLSFLCNMIYRVGINPKKKKKYNYDDDNKCK